MPKTSLVIHQIRVREQGTRKDLTLSKFNRKDDILKIMQTYLNLRKKEIWSHDEAKRALKVEIYKTEGRYIAGRMQCGDFGYRADVLNIESGVVDYKQTPHHSPLQSFYFLIYIPVSGKYGFVVTQRLGIYGATGSFQADFEEYFVSIEPKHEVKFEIAIPEEMIEEFLATGEIIRIRFLSKTAPKEIEDVVRSGGIKTLKSELIISAKQSGTIKLKDTLLKAIRSRQDIRSYITLDDFPYDDIKVEFKSGSRKKTMRLTDVLQLRPEIDITDQVSTDSEGLPNFDSIDDLAKEWLQSLLNSLEKEESDVSED